MKPVWVRPKIGVVLLLWLVTISLFAGYRKVHESPYHELYSRRSALSSDLALSNALSHRIADLQINLGIYPDSRVKIYVVHKAAEYQALSLGKAEIVEFSDAFYSGKEGVIYIRSQDQIQDNYLKILVHEYIHWYLEELFLSTPLWFHEGMATYHSKQMGYERYLMYLRESLINPKSDLFRIGYEYPRARSDWPRFYLSSAMAVRYMQDKYPSNWQRFWDIVASHNKTGQKLRFHEAFQLAYHIDLWDFHQDFERYSKRQGYLYLIVAANSLIFACLPFVMLAVARKRKRRMENLPDLPEPRQAQGSDTADKSATD
jgi:hypothetical protein